MEKEEFGRSLTSCLFDGINSLLSDEIEIEEDYLPISISDELIFTAQTEEQGLGLQSLSLDENGFFEQEGLWFSNSKNLRIRKLSGSSLSARVSKRVCFI